MSELTPNAAAIKPDTVPIKVASLPRPVTIRYIGFECTSEGRSYRLRVDRGAEDPRLFTVSVPSEAFESRRARFQDAAEMCLQRLQRELDENAELPPDSALVITTADLDSYRETQQRRSPARKPRAPHTER
jgi:hypothetical protein